MVLCPTAICPTAIAKEEQSTRVGPTDNFEQSKEKNYPPTSLVTPALYLLLVGRGSLCALCAPSGRRGESRRAGDGNPALLLLCSNWPQQPAAASRSDFHWERCGSHHHRPSEDTLTRPVRSRTSPIILNTKYTDKERKLSEQPHGDPSVCKEQTRLSLV